MATKKLTVEQLGELAVEAQKAINKYRAAVKTSKKDYSMGTEGGGVHAVSMLDTASFLVCAVQLELENPEE